MHIHASANDNTGEIKNKYLNQLNDQYTDISNHQNDRVFSIKSDASEKNEQRQNSILMREEKRSVFDKDAVLIQNRPKQEVSGETTEIAVSKLQIFVGESYTFKTNAIERVAVGNGQLLSADISNNNQEISLFAHQEGSTTVSIWHGKNFALPKQILVEILSNETAKTQREVVTFIKNIPGVITQMVGDKVILEGENLSDSDQEKIAEIAKRYPQIINFTNRIGWEKMILIDVKVVEFPTSTLRHIGLLWGTQGGINFGANWNSKLDTKHSTPFAFFSINTLLLSQLHLLSQKGEAVILAHPKLSTRNGSTAVFFAGGEIPYQTNNQRNGNRGSVIFKPYGIKLEIQPKVDNNNVIRAVIDTEVSSIDAAVETSAGPALRTRRTKAEFNLHDGQTLVLSGFLTQEQIRNQYKFPILGDIPILGALFRSEKFQQRETELMIFVTPYITDSKKIQEIQQFEENKMKFKENFEERNQSNG